MPPGRPRRRVINNTTTTQPPPPPQHDLVAFQAAVTTAVAAAMTQICTSVTSGSGSGAHPTNYGYTYGHPRECSYKDFTNCKPKSFKGDGEVITIMQWFEKTELVFEIYTCPEGSKVKFASSTFSGRTLTWWNSRVKSLKLSVDN